MKSFPSPRRSVLLGMAALASTLAAGVFAASARGELPEWIRNVVSRSPLESVFFRWMALPGGQVHHRRPPSETRPELRRLASEQPQDSDLFSLLALEDEQQLDFRAAEADWKKFAETTADKSRGELALADFYHRRMRIQDEIQALSTIANSPSPASEKLTPPAGQQSWRAFERIFILIGQQGLAAEVSMAQYRSWIARYPKEASLYSRYLDFLLSVKDYEVAERLVEEYRKEFPEDEIFAVKATALVAYRRGALPEGLAVYEKSFQPLWHPELVKSYFDLLRQTQNLRKFLDEQNAALSKNPEDLRATALIFYYYQQAGQLEAAKAQIARFRMHKEAAHTEWTSRELYVFARLLEEVHVYPEAARYYFALYNAKDAPDAQPGALAGLARVLLDAPEMPMPFGAGGLSMYRDIASMDPGPGYLNGILSLILNTTDPAEAYGQEEQRAVPYFHRSQAAGLVALLDAKYPKSADRPGLHAKLIGYYSGSGESDAVIRTGKEFLANFPNSEERTTVALEMADAYARQDKTQEEFAIYDAVLKELAAKADGVPLGNGVARLEGSYPQAWERTTDAVNAEDDQESGENANTAAGGKTGAEGAFQLGTRPAQATQAGARSPEYARVLERYLGRLAQLKQISQAIGVLRNELDHNPDDPGLYGRLAEFLEQNRVEAEQEEVYKRAMARFPDESWYSRLARFYLRQKQEQAYVALTEGVVNQFSGTPLERYFQSTVSGGSPELYLQLNLYAHNRFPHNLVFVENLLGAYLSPRTRDLAAWEKLLREHWFEDATLRNEYFSFLSRTGQLEPELASLRQASQPASGAERLVRENPAAGEFLAQAYLWRSQYEESAPYLKHLAALYPADRELGQTAASVFRSLAYYRPENTEAAIKIGENLLAANPGSTDILSRIGDTLADRELWTRAAPYWNRIPQVMPGQPDGYLEAATIYWDYFDFDNALRLLDEARKKFGNSALYAYEEGAIYEGKRDHEHAIGEYVKGSLAAGAGSPADFRLMQLAKRPRDRAVVDKDTQASADEPGAAFAAIALRARVLETLERKKDVETLLDTAVNRATTLEEAAEIETLAGQYSLETVREHAIEKQAGLTTDPVTRLQLRYRLVQLYQGRKDLASAKRNMEELYHENPKILGVVRATVDFYWQTKQYAEAIGALEQAARDAYPALSRQFTFEAARKATTAKLYPKARTLLASLLHDSPYDPQYLAAMADTYGAEGDAQGLKQFYAAEIAAFQAASLPTEVKKAQIAALRRGLIPALTTLNDFTGAVDQYIEVIDAFPADEALADEAALYAARHHLEERLINFYAKTMQQSPRDERWAVVLARVQTALENFPAAIEAYGNAIGVRPDRSDLRIARAGLAERLMRFDDAVADYTKLYDLAYKDPQWMDKVAEIRARQGRTAEVVGALRTAYIDGKPERAEKYFEVARRLEGWNLLPEARNFAEQGLKAAGNDLLASAENHTGAALYTRVMTRLRQQDIAYARLEEALAAASSELEAVARQVAREGIAGVTDAELRTRMRESRIQQARTGFRGALVESGHVAAAYFTPEEKAALAASAQKLRGSMNLEDVEAFAVPLADAAGLEDLDAQWRYEIASARSGQESEILARIEAYANLQRRRLKFEELAPQLEKLAPTVPHSTYAVLMEAAGDYRSSGDEVNELRVLSGVPAPYMGRDVLTRYCELLMKKDPQALVRVASNWTIWGEQAAQYAVTNGSAALAHQVVAARARPRVPVWKSAYDALTGMYFAESAPAIGQSFLAALGDQTIGERIGKKTDRSRQLAGDIWFYYGSRYGEYLGEMKQGNSEEFLPAVLEQSPASASGYLQVADYYVSHGDPRAAIMDYNHVLELKPADVDAHLRLALAYLKQQNRTGAVEQWKQAMAQLARQVKLVVVPESYWNDFARLTKDSASHRMFADLKPEADAVLRAYLKKNGNYRSNELLKSAYTGLGNPAAATEWTLNLASAARDPVAVLADIVDAPWIPLANRGPIYERIVRGKTDVAESATETEKEQALADLRSWQFRQADYLIRARQYAGAAAVLASLPASSQSADPASYVPLELRIAAHESRLEAKLAAYRADEEHAPSAEILRAAADEIRKAGQAAEARRLMEFVYTREIDERHLLASNFLGLAEIRIETGDLPGAMQLLRRLAGVVGNPFENLEPAAALLEKTGHPAEAAEFLEELAKATPWNASYRLRWAQARMAPGKDAAAARDVIAACAADAAVPYQVRVEAARTLSGQHSSTGYGSAELSLLAGAAAQITAVAADKPYFYEARVSAAASITEPRARIQLLRNAVATYPAREEAEYALFEAAAAGQSDRLAIAALHLTSAQRLIVRAVPTGEEEGEGEPAAESGSAGSEGEASAIPGKQEPALSPARRVRVALEAAEVLERLDELKQSLAYLQGALRLEKATERRAGIRARISAVRKEINRRKQNEARQPILHQELEQNRLVRAQLPATRQAQTGKEAPRP